MPPPPFMHGKGMRGKGRPPMMPYPGHHREAIDTQRFAVERKRRLRELVGVMHGDEKSREPADPSVKATLQQQTKEFQEAIALQLEGNRLPLHSPSELVIADALWLLWLQDHNRTDEDRELLMNLARLVKASGTRARQYLIQVVRRTWPRSGDSSSSTAPPRSLEPSLEILKLFSLLAVSLPGRGGAPGKGQTGGGIAASAQEPPAEQPLSPEEEKKVKRYRDLICEIYEEHNPSKLSDVDGLLKKYRGKEEMVYKGVCEKYKVQPKVEKPKEEEPPKVLSVDKIKQLISEIYKEHNKEKLGEIDTLMKKYEGKEKTLYLAVCQKYNVEPKLPEAKKKEKKKKKEKEAVVDAEKANAERVAKVKAAIEGVYKEHNPSKLEDIAGLLAKYKGREEMLYFAVCDKYNAPKDPSIQVQKPAEARPPENGEESLGNLEWMGPGEEPLVRMLERLVSVMALHSSGMQEEDAKRHLAWEDVKPNPAPRSLNHRFELSGLPSSQIENVAKILNGEDGAQWAKLEEKCEGAEVKGLVLDGSAPAGVISVVAESSASEGRRPFDAAVLHLTSALSSAVRNSVESDNEDNGPAGDPQEKCRLPWSCQEVTFLPIEEEGNLGRTRQDVAVEYRRGCWTLKRHSSPHAYSAVYHLTGNDVEARLPKTWRQLADKLWLALLGLSYGPDFPPETVLIVQSASGHEARPPSAKLPGGCSASSPGASLTITARSLEDLEQAQQTVAPLLSRVLSELQLHATFTPSSLYMPQQKRRSRAIGLGLPVPRDAPEVASSSSDEDDEDILLSEEEILSDAEPTEGYRPLRLTRAQVRDAYLQGLLCLNCDAADHKHQDCPFRKKVCWNCHGNHAGNECPTRCRFCRMKHDYPLLECVKRVCRRVADWKKSHPAQEQRNVLGLLELLMIKLEGFADADLAKHNREVQLLIRQLAEKCTLFPIDLSDLALSILDMRASSKMHFEQAVPPPPPGLPPETYVAPKLPKEPLPVLPENKYPWSEKIFLDSLLDRGTYGCHVLSRIIGRGGMHHRRMESESGARVFFRGLGVSGRDMELAEPVDCRLHIAVKGEAPLQARTVRRIIKEILIEIDAEIRERGETGPLMDRPKDPEQHPFGFMLSSGIGPENDEPLKFKFSEEDGQSLTELLGWMKQAKMPVELDSDTQWRTTLQVTPVEPPLPDDAPDMAELVADAFQRLINDWQQPCPYWFEEQDLHPTGLWTALTSGDKESGGGPIGIQQDQGVRLSAKAVEHFATLMERAELAPVPRELVVQVLGRLRGVVRKQVEDEQLLMYLQYPWAWFAEGLQAKGKDLKLPFNREQVQMQLMQLGRIGGRPTEANAAPPIKGFWVEWMPVKAGGRPPSLPLVSQIAPAPMRPTLPAPVPMRPQQVLYPTQLPMQIPGMTQPWPLTPSTPLTLPVRPMVPAMSSKPRGICKYWLPEAAFRSRQDLKELIAGPGGANFGHVLKKFPSVQLRMEGQASTAAPPAHRLHVSMSSEDSEIFESAAADVLDLVETVCDMIGEELNLTEEQVEGLIREIRAEKYFEAHGIRTPLKPVKQGAAEAAAAAAAAVQRLQAAHAAAKAEPLEAADFEFIDEDVDMDQAVDADADTEDDAATEASDVMSDITEADDAPKAPAFDDL